MRGKCKTELQALIFICWQNQRPHLCYPENQKRCLKRPMTGILRCKMTEYQTRYLITSQQEQEEKSLPWQTKIFSKKAQFPPNGYPQSFFPGINYPNVIELSICDKPLFEVTGIKTECPLFVKENASEILCSSSCLFAWNDGEQVVWMMWILRGLYSS